MIWGLVLCQVQRWFDTWLQKLDSRLHLRFLFCGMCLLSQLMKSLLLRISWVGLCQIPNKWYGSPWFVGLGFYELWGKSSVSLIKQATSYMPVLQKQCWWVSGRETQTFIFQYAMCPPIEDKECSSTWLVIMPLFVWPSPERWANNLLCYVWTRLTIWRIVCLAKCKRLTC